MHCKRVYVRLNQTEWCLMNYTHHLRNSEQTEWLPILLNTSAPEFWWTSRTTKIILKPRTFHNLLLQNDIQKHPPLKLWSRKSYLMYRKNPYSLSNDYVKKRLDLTEPVTKGLINKDHCRILFDGHHFIASRRIG